MNQYLLSLLSIVALCACWAAFQLWLTKKDPDAAARSQKCGGCGRRDECDGNGRGPN